MREDRAALVLLRHGESTANAEGRFTGWWDVPLTTRGCEQARQAANLLAAAGFVPDVIFASPLQRTTQTAEIIVHTLGHPAIPVVRRPELTERAYGALTGLSKAEVRDVFGAARSRWWRRSMTGLPPRVGEAGPALRPGQVLPHRDNTMEILTAAEHRESLADVVARVRTWQAGQLVPRLAAGKNVLVVAHGNSLRALVARLDHLDDDEVGALNIPTGQPLRYSVGNQGQPLPRSGRYLDPDTARAAAQAVAAEGGT